MDLNSLLKRLEHDSCLAIKWFENNNMKLNQDKSHLLVSGCKNENVWANIGNEKIWGCNKQKLLGLDIDRNLNFKKHVSSLYRKVDNTLSVLARLSNFMSFKQRRILLKTFIESFRIFLESFISFFEFQQNDYYFFCLFKVIKITINFSQLLFSVRF